MRNNKICPKCRSSFKCEPDNDCWCENTQIHRREMVLLLQNYNDCLCPSCLKEYTED